MWLLCASHIAYPSLRILFLQENALHRVQALNHYPQITFGALPVLWLSTSCPALLHCPSVWGVLFSPTQCRALNTRFVSPASLFCYRAERGALYKRSSLSINTSQWRLVLPASSGPSSSLTSIFILDCPRGSGSLSVVWKHLKEYLTGKRGKGDRWEKMRRKKDAKWDRKKRNR